MTYNENAFELDMLQWFAELGYETLHGPNITGEGKERETHKQVLLLARLRTALQAINPNATTAMIDEAVKRVQNLPGADIITQNRAFHTLLTDGIDIEVRRADNSMGTEKLWLFDFENPQNNNYAAVNQFTIVENKNRRPDIIVFVNGIPLSCIELKNPTDENATLRNAYQQLQTYKNDIPSLFAYNELLVVSDGINTSMGTITSNYDRFMAWRTRDGQTIEPLTRQSESMIYGAFAKERLLGLIRNFVVFHSSKQSDIKILAAYHQYSAVEMATRSTKKAVETDGRAGVVWHTQGSGKSLSMVFYAGQLVQKLNNPTLLILTDRNDLDDQLFGTFSKSHELLRQKPIQAKNRVHLRKLLQVASGGVVFTTIQKFSPDDTDASQHPTLSTRRNIIVIADEAHRSQYGFSGKATDEGIKYGFAKYLRDAVPNAAFIGFTGTPIDMKDKSTQGVFGDYIHVYDIARAIEDKATVPIYYEARLPDIRLEEDKLQEIDDLTETLLAEMDEKDREQYKRKHAGVKAIVGHPERLKLVAKDIVDHWQQRLNVMEGKAMIVTMSREIAVNLYTEIVKIRPEWHNEEKDKGAIKIIMTGSASDPAHFQPHLHDKKTREELAERMRDTSDPLQMVIVVDMWLTGFDAPCIHTMYLDKPMKGHGLMQAIARVNRVNGDKPSGLVVDYLGIASEIKKALHQYTESGGEGHVVETQDDAIALMREKYEVVTDMLHGYDYGAYFSDSGASRTDTLMNGVEYVLGLDDGKSRYFKAVNALSQAFAIAVPSEPALKLRDEVALFQAIKAGMAKLEGTDHGTAEHDYKHAIRDIIAGAVVPQQVVDIFDEAALEKPEISLLSDEFLEEVAGMKRKNVALEVLKRILNDQIKGMSKRNLTQSKAFSEMLVESLRRYQNRSIEAAEVITELIDLAKKLREEKARGNKLGLNDDEIAFYDALAVNEEALRTLGDETLKQIANELVEMLRRDASLDWTIKESVQAKIRFNIKRLLRKYKYPPDDQPQAIDRVLEQASITAKDFAENK